MGDEIVRVDICSGPNKPRGFIGVDMVAGPDIDIVHDLSKGFPFEDSSVDYLRAHDAIEHLHDKIETMNEIFRVCKNGATVDIKVPSTDGRGAYQDPTHVSYWNINSFYYYCADFPNYHKQNLVYGFKGDFQLKQLYNIGTRDNVVHVVAMMMVRKKPTA